MSRVEIFSNREILTISNKEDKVLIETEDLTNGMSSKVELSKEKAELAVREIIKNINMIKYKTR